jgi:hypothetical protein
VRVQERAIALGNGRFTVVDRQERALRAQASRERTRHARAQRRIPALDTDQDQVRGQPVLQLIDQQLLRGRGHAWQERRQIGTETRARDDHGREAHADQPQPQCQRTRAAHSRGVIFISE